MSQPSHLPQRNQIRLLRLLDWPSGKPALLNEEGEGKGQRTWSSCPWCLEDFISPWPTLGWIHSPGLQTASLCLWNPSSRTESLSDYMIHQLESSNGHMLRGFREPVWPLSETDLCPPLPAWETRGGWPGVLWEGGMRSRGQRSRLIAGWLQVINVGVHVLCSRVKPGASVPQRVSQACSALKVHSGRHWLPDFSFEKYKTVQSQRITMLIINIY